MRVHFFALVLCQREAFAQQALDPGRSAEPAKTSTWTVGRLCSSILTTRQPDELGAAPLAERPTAAGAATSNSEMLEDVGLGVNAAQQALEPGSRSQKP